MEAQGNSSEPQNYKFDHLNPRLGKNYYRLKIIDLDNNFEYSQIEVVQFSRDNKLTIFPNPSNSLFNIVLENNQWLEKIEIHNGLGQLVFVKELGIDTQELSIRPNLPSGIYNLSVFTENDNRFNKTIIIQ